MSTTSTGSGLIVHGVAPDSGNLGLNALCNALLDGLRAHSQSVPIGVLGFGRGDDPFVGMPGIERLVAYNTRRYHRRESLWNIRVSSRLGSGSNPLAKRIANAGAFLDASGGDSFTDLYGDQRFRSMVLPKRIAIENGVPLVLLPQTYGPFNSKRSQRVASSLVRSTHAAWARDQRSFESLKELLGDAFDPSRHRSGVDLAFGLRPSAPGERSLGESAWILDQPGEVVGMNVSGLLFDDPRSARDRFGFKADYGRVILETASSILDKSEARLLLVPHVLAAEGASDCDANACELVRAELAQKYGGRVTALPRGLNERETKWCIARTEWFCGTRMHSTIAALGSGVACAAVAYSKKTLGVFEMCGLGDSVADPRSLDTEEVIGSLVQSYEGRALNRARLAQHLPSVLAEAKSQMGEIAVAAGIVEPGQMVAAAA